MEEIWHKLNKELTDKERAVFNKWKIELWCLAEKEESSILLEVVSKIPSLSK